MHRSDDGPANFSLYSTVYNQEIDAAEAGDGVVEGDVLVTAALDKSLKTLSAIGILIDAAMKEKKGATVAVNFRLDCTCSKTLKGVWL